MKKNIGLAEAIVGVSLALVLIALYITLSVVNAKNNSYCTKVTGSCTAGYRTCGFPSAGK